MRAPGNGAVFVGSKGYMATTARGEGVWLLPALALGRIQTPAADVAARRQSSAGLDSLLQRRRPGVSDFAVATKYIEWLALGAIALRVPGKLM